MFDRESSRTPPQTDGPSRGERAPPSAPGSLRDLMASQGERTLILDAAGERILDASSDLTELRAAIGGSDGLIVDRLRLGPQLRGIGSVDPSARLIRLRLDPRGLAPPVACRVTRRDLGDGTPVLIVEPIGRIPTLRATRYASQASVTPPLADDGPSVATDGDAPAAGETTSEPALRLVWSSDAEGSIGRITGDAAVAAALVGRRWSAMADDGTVEAPGLLDALAAGRTFRALPAILRPPGGSDEFALDLFGAPAARADRPFAGFTGFAVVRERRAVPPVRADAPKSPPSVEPAVGIPEPAPDGEKPSDPATVLAPSPVPTEDGPGAGADSAELTPRPERADDGAGAALSVNENAAFREIARALGARFAGDDGAEARQPSIEASTGETSRSSVTAFPVRPSLRGAALTAVLDQLPVALLIHRGAVTLFANRRFLAVAGYADTAAYDAAGGLARLTDASGPAAIVDCAELDWEGGPAEAVIVEASTRREQVARDLHDAHRVAHQHIAASTLDALADGVVTLDAAGRVVRLSVPAAQVLSAAPREVVGGAFVDLFAADGQAAVRAAIDAAREGRIGLVDAAGLRGPGAPTVRIRVAGIAGEGPTLFCATLGEPAGAQGSSRGDAILRHDVEDAGIRKAGFLAKVSHEIRTPLNGILGFVDAMLAEQYGPLGSERYREYLNDVHASGEHVLGVVTDLLDLARIEAGRADLTFTDLALNDLIANCISLIQPQAARDRIVLRTSLAPDLRLLNADERSMRQAALNVIANAIRFTEAGGQVIVSTTLAERGEIVLRVRDTGVGMTPEEVENALEPFRQVAVAGPNRGGGTGLGLTLTKALVEANRGRFRITSRKREGTLVEMVFPGADRARTA